jgi:hypothetical protein
LIAEVQTLKVAFDEMVARQAMPELAELAKSILEKISSGSKLNPGARYLTALALQGYAMHHGPKVFDEVKRLAKFFGVEGEFTELLHSWIASAGRHGNRVGD